MVKGEDAIRRKKNKARRKKLQKDDSSTTVSARVAAIIASKKRRKSGKRRVCEGMCYSLPTPDDPFNDRHEKKDFSKKELKKQVSSQPGNRVSTKVKSDPLKKGKACRKSDKFSNDQQIRKKDMLLENKPKDFLKTGQVDIQKIEENNVHAKKSWAAKYSDCPSKFLIMCLNKMQEALQQDNSYHSVERPLYANAWGLEFWKCYSLEKDILETSGSGSLIEKIAWLACSVADTIARKENEGLSFSNPFLLFVVPSQAQAIKVRSILKPMKSLGIHTVSLHSGASIDHQIHGLKSCEPEFLVSTPARLLELVDLKAIDVSGVSVMAVDGLEPHPESGYVHTINSIRKSVSRSAHIVVFSECSSDIAVNMAQSLLTGSICRLSLDGSIRSQSACILQSVRVLASEEEKQSQAIRILEHVSSKDLSNACKVLILVGNESKFFKLVADSISQENRKRIHEVKVFNIENINTIDLGDYEAVMVPDFVPSIDIYVQILKGMARHTVNGALHSFLTKDNARLAGPLIGILEDCGQQVPETLRNICHSTSPVLE